MLNAICGFVILLSVTVFAGVKENAGSILFERERIDAVLLSCDTLEISGIYYFSNIDSSAKTMSIFYPFPIDSFHIYPHFIRLVAMSKKQDTSYSMLSGGIGFNISVGPGKTDSIKIIYRQKIHHGQGRYILTTTKYWNKPFERADYSITFPLQITLNYWSFQFDSLAQNKDNITYFAHRKLFMPTEDMIMKWKCK